MIIADRQEKLDLAYLCAGLVGGLVLGGTVVHLLWANAYERHMDADRKAERDAAAYVQDKTVDNAKFSNALEQGLVQDAKTTDAAVASAKSRLRAVPTAAAKPAPDCGPGAYVIQPGFGPDDWYGAYRTGRDSVLYPDGIRAGPDLHPAPDADLVPAATAP